MTILTVDVGNTNIAFGIHDGTRWIDHWRLRTEATKTDDEYFVLFHNLFTLAGHHDTRLDRTVVSSVVPTLTPAIARVTERLTGQSPLLVSHSLVTGLDQSTPVPGELGNDLLANAVAAYHIYQRATIVVDFGTALTFTAVSGEGRILGVSIAPGLRSAVGSLGSNTAQLPTVDLNEPPSALGRTTVHSIQAGIVYGYVGLISEVTRRMAAEMDETPHIIATGGLAETFAPVAACFDDIDQWLTLEGLRILGELNPL